MQRKIGEIYERIHSASARSCWEKGVICYADEMLEAYLSGKGLGLKDIHVRIGKITEVDLLRGLPNWGRYSRGGMALVSNEAICRRLCTRAVFKKKLGGQVPPSTGGKDWLDFQATALEAAAKIVLGAVNVGRRIVAEGNGGIKNREKGEGNSTNRKTAKREVRDGKIRGGNAAGSDGWR